MQIQNGIEVKCVVIIQKKWKTENIYWMNKCVLP